MCIQRGRLPWIVRILCWIAAASWFCGCGGCGGGLTHAYNLTLEPPPPSPPEADFSDPDVFGGLDYDAGYAFYEHEIKDPIECYSCHFSTTKDHQQGMVNCDEPFNDVGIPVIDCRGSCAKTKTNVGPKEYMVVRSCLPNCKDIADPYSSVQCCTGAKCNGIKPSNVVMMSSLGVGSFVFILTLFCILCTKKM